MKLKSLSYAITACFLIINSFSIAHADTKIDKDAPFYDIGKDFLYTLGYIDKKDIIAIKNFDKMLINLNAVDSDYKYTEPEKLAQLYHYYLVIQQQKNKNSKIIKFTPYELVFELTVPKDFTDDFQKDFFRVIWQSPSIVKGLCERLYTPKSFRANNVKISYHYVDKQGKPLFNLVLDMDTCKGTTPISNYQPIQQTPDESLSELTKQLNQRFTQRINHATQAEKNSFYYSLAMGLQFPQGKDSTADIIKRGKKIVNNINQLENNPQFSQEQQNKAIDKVIQKYQRIQLSDNPLFCNLQTNKKDKHQTEKCLNSLLKPQIQIQKQWQQLRDKPINQLILQRYQNYLAMPPAVNVFEENNVHNPLPRYQVLRRGQKLQQLQILQLAKLGHTQQALDMALQEFVQLRQKFAKADTLLAKSIFRVMMSRELQTMVLLKTHYVDAKQPLKFQAISPLTPNELNMEMAILAEYSGTNNNIKSIYTPKDKKILKINESINNNAKIYQRVINETKVSPSQLVTRVLKPTREVEEKKKLEQMKAMFSPSNQLGWQFVGMLLLDFDTYNIRFHNLNNHINAVNYLLTDGKVALKNTFAPRLQGVEKTNSSICYDIPKDDEKTEKMQIGQSCLLW